MVFNTTALLTFRLDNSLKKLPSMVILSFVCVTDTFSLFTWNLNHFLKPNYNIVIEEISEFNCRFFFFIQYACLEGSGLLLSLVCIDRYFTIISKPGSFISKLPFGTKKSATIWSISIIIFIALLNSYLLFMERKYKNGKLFCYELETEFSVVITWEKIHLFLYSGIPSILMIIFNFLLIRKTIDVANRYSKNKKIRNLSITLTILTASFLIMTLPASIGFGFFYDDLPYYVLVILDYVSFANHCSLFFNCLIVNYKFRQSLTNLVLGLFGKNVLNRNKTNSTRANNTTSIT